MRKYRISKNMKNYTNTIKLNYLGVHKNVPRSNFFTINVFKQFFALFA